MENNDKLVSKRRVVSKRSTTKIQLFSIITGENNSKFVNVLKLLKRRFPFRLSDTIIIGGMIGCYCFLLALWKNYFNDVLRTLKPYKLYYKFWIMFPYTQPRQPKDPFIYPPGESEVRDFEQYTNYEKNKNKLIFNKLQQYDVTVRSQKERVLPALDHRELDTTEYQTLVKMNFDIKSLDYLKKNINIETIKTGIYTNDKLYIRERLTTSQKSSAYMFKNELYKELSELVEI